MTIYSHLNVVDYCPFDVKWIPKSCRLAAMGNRHDGTGILALYEMEKGKLKNIETVGMPSEIKCGTFRCSSTEDRSLAFGDFSGSLHIIDVSRPSSPIYTTKAHKGVVNSIDAAGTIDGCPGPSEIVTGGRDGCVRVFDPRQQEAVAEVCPETGSIRPDCWAVAMGGCTSPTQRYVVAGFDNGDIILLDLRTQKVSWRTNLKHGVCGLEFDRMSIHMNKLVATTLGGKMVVFDMRTFYSKGGYAFTSCDVHKSTVWCVKHLPQNRDVWASSGGNGSVNIYKYKYPSNRFKMNSEGEKEGVAGEVKTLNEIYGSGMPVCGMDWNRDKPGVCALASLDKSIRVMLVDNMAIL